MAPVIYSFVEPFDLFDRDFATGYIYIYIYIYIVYIYIYI